MKKVFAISLLVLLVIVSCKKDPSTQITNTNNPKNTRTTTTNTVTASYNITYHLWYPYMTLYGVEKYVPLLGYGPYPTNADSTVSYVISLDSTSIHNIKFVVSINFAGYFGGGMPTPEYASDAEILRSGNDTTVFIASHKHNNTNILTNATLPYSTEN